MRLGGPNPLDFRLEDTPARAGQDTMRTKLLLPFSVLFGLAQVRSLYMLASTISVATRMHTALIEDKASQVEAAFDEELKLEDPADNWADFQHSSQSDTLAPYAQRAPKFDLAPADVADDFVRHQRCVFMDMRAHMS